MPVRPRCAHHRVTGSFGSQMSTRSLLRGYRQACSSLIIPALTNSSQPILKEATSTLSEGSKVVINSADQYEVFDNPNASDPSHSLLSKVCPLRDLGLTDLNLSAVQDHFALILNEPVRPVGAPRRRFDGNALVGRKDSTGCSPIRRQVDRQRLV